MTEENTLAGETKARLLRAAELTETETSATKRKADIAADLEANEIDWDYYKDFVLPQIEQEEKAAEVAEALEADSNDEPKANPADGKSANAGTVTTESLTPQTVEEDEEEEAYDAGDSEQVLVRYTGFSKWYEKKGYKFLKDHPFVPVDKDDVDDLLAASPLLRIASPREAQDFYA